MRIAALVFSVGLHVLIVLALWHLEPAPVVHVAPAEELTVVFREPSRPPPPPAPRTPAPARAAVRARRAAPAQVRHVETEAPPRAADRREPARNDDDGGGAAGAGDAPGDGAAGATGHAAGGGAAQPPVVPRVDVVTPARVLGLPTIEYPPAALADELEGRVRLWVVLDASGQLVRVDVLSEPGGGLGAAARAALLRARFEPARRGAQPIPSAFEYVYRFELR